MHQYFNIEHSAGFMNIHKIIPYKGLQISLTQTLLLFLNIVVHILIDQFILPHGYFNARSDYYERLVVQYRQTWLSLSITSHMVTENRIRTAQGLKLGTQQPIGINVRHS